jgi:succinate dehydrogenase hydrophobic anchor subunit
MLLLLLLLLVVLFISRSLVPAAPLRRWHLPSWLTFLLLLLLLLLLCHLPLI